MDCNFLLLNNLVNLLKIGVRGVIVIEENKERRNYKFEMLE